MSTPGAAAILTLLVFLFFWKVIFGGQSFFLLDLTTADIPAHVWLKHHAASLWNRYLIAGQPAIANPQHYVFEPLHRLSLWLPEIWGFHVFLVSRFIIAGCGFLIFLRRWGLSPAAALFGALLFIFGGVFVSLPRVPLTLISLTFLPWTLWAFLAALESAKNNRWIWLLVAAMSLGLQILGGEPQVVAMTLAFLPVLACARRKGDLPRALGFVSLVGVASWLFAAVQILPFLEFLPHSNRLQSRSWMEATQWSLQPAALLNFCLPHHFINAGREKGWGFGFWESEMPYIASLYLGVVALLCVGRKIRDGRSARVLWSVVGISLLLALGRNSWFFRAAFTALPPLRGFRFPEKFLVLTHLALSILAALGFEEMIRAPRRRRWIYFAIVSLAMAVILPAAFLTLKASGANYWALYFPLEAARVFVFLALASAAAALLPSGAPRAAALICILLMDLWQAHFQVNPTVASDFFSEPEFVATMKKTQPARLWVRLHEQAKIERLAALPEHFQKMRQRFEPVVGLSYDLAQINSGFSLHHHAIDDFQHDFAENPEAAFHRFGVRWIISSVPIDYTFLNLRQEAHLPNSDIGIAYLYENEAVAALVEARPASPDMQTHFQDDRVSVEISSLQPVELIHRQVHYPGWEVAIDGSSAVLDKFDGLFQGVHVPAGRHSVVFSYRPRHFRLGLLVSLGAWAAGLALLAVYGFKRR